MDELTKIAEFVNKYGAAGILLGLIVSLFARWWVPFYLLEQAEQRATWWQRYALSLQELTDQALKLTERATEKGRV